MATYTIKINERTALGKSILNLLRNTDIVEFEADMDKVLDPVLLNKMKKNSKRQYATNSEKTAFLNSLNSVE